VPVQQGVDVGAVARGDVDVDVVVAAVPVDVDVHGPVPLGREDQAEGFQHGEVAAVRESVRPVVVAAAPAAGVDKGQGHHQAQGPGAAPAYRVSLDHVCLTSPC